MVLINLGSNWAVRFYVCITRSQICKPHNHLLRQYSKSSNQFINYLQLDVSSLHSLTLLPSEFQLLSLLLLLYVCYLYEVFLNCQLILCFFLEKESHIRLPSLNIRWMRSLVSHFVNESPKVNLRFNESPLSVYILRHFNPIRVIFPIWSSHYAKYSLRFMLSLQNSVPKLCLSIAYHISYL